MTRQWEPGDVAEYDGIRVMFTQDEEGNRGAVDAEGDRRSGEAFRNSRPLVVIDPEDDEQVDRLESICHRLGYISIGATGLRYALREFANPTPPKPEEPTGHMAVVEDSSGNRWVNWRDPRDTHLHEKPWVMASDGDCREYRDIAAVKVLSEGVVQ